MEPPSDDSPLKAGSADDHFNTRILEDSIFIAKSKYQVEEHKDYNDSDNERQPLTPNSKKKSSSVEKIVKNKNLLKSNNVGGGEERRRPKTVFGNRNRDKMREKLEPKVPQAMTVEEKKQKWIKSLPPQIRHLSHLDCIKDPMILDK